MTSDFPPDPARRRLLSLLLGGGAGVALGGSAVAQGYGLSTSDLTAPMPRLTRPLRLTLLTDLHYGLYIGPQSLGRWVEATLASRPDLILLGGDLLDRQLGLSPAVMENFLNGLRPLRAPLGVYAVWGNHDYGSFGAYSGTRSGPARAGWQTTRAEVAHSLSGVGIRVLRNEGVAVREDLWLGGTDDLWHGEPDPAAALAGAGTRSRLMLTHNPDQLLTLPAAARPDLMLCGHTHGGQVRLPLVGAVKVPADPRFTMGWVSYGGVRAYVSRGLGMSGVPARFLCPPEIVNLTLTPGAAT